MDISKYAYGTTTTTNNNTIGTFYLPTPTKVCPDPSIEQNKYWGISSIKFVCEELGHKNNPKKERKPNMEILYQVIVVSKDREILSESKIVAEDKDEAKLGVDIHHVLRGGHLKLKDVTILCVELGDVKVRKEVQKIKVVDKDEV